MKALVTGAAGFIGSHLTERLADAGWQVVALDSLTPYYEVSKKRENMEALVDRSEVSVECQDLNSADLNSLLQGVDVVFHQAGQPGVRKSWNDFEGYLKMNVSATHRLLEAVRQSEVSRFVFASSSSIYGDSLQYPTPEDLLPRPRSPYGVTKLAAENLCAVYARNFDVHTIALRYFTVFGPRQRPDMAMYRLIESALTGRPFPRFGDGEQVRDFTYVDDVIEANLAAARADIYPGAIVNVAGGGATTLNAVIELVEELTDRPISTENLGEQAGDVSRTRGAIELAKSLLGWEPQTSVRDGLERQVAWQLRLQDSRSRV